MERTQVEHVAKLARLTLAEDEVELYSKELGEILAYVQVLQQVDTGAVELDTCTSSVPLTALRDDLPGESLPVSVVLTQAPEYVDDYFKTPQILQGKEGV